MSELLVISRSLELGEVCVERSADGRTIEARALSYNVPYDVSDDGGASYYVEQWHESVFTKSLKERGGRIPLLVSHDRRRLPIGATIGVATDVTDAFVFRAKISATRDGDEAIELIQDGALTGVSVGCRPLQNQKLPGGGICRMQARLDEISLTPFQQMADGRVLAVRSTDVLDETEEPGQTVVADETGSATKLAEAQQYLADMKIPE